MRRRAPLLVLAAALSAGAPAAAAATAPLPPPVPAHLQGTFAMGGRVTVASIVRGEHRGQAVARSWTFSAGCPTGPCHTVMLRRQRAAGFDTVKLVQQRPGYYVGQGRFYRPLHCGSRLYRPGERVPFTITVRIVAAQTAGGQAVASAIYATYVNASRINLTPCVAYLGHDSAVYLGGLTPPPS